VSAILNFRRRRDGGCEAYCDDSMAEDLRSELYDARSQNQNLRQEHRLDEMRQVDADSVVMGNVETLEFEMAELQLHITTVQTKGRLLYMADVR
jgi:hypothetical protein